jgi:hypothetical protein
VLRSWFDFAALRSTNGKGALLGDMWCLKMLALDETFPLPAVASPQIPSLRCVGLSSRRRAAQDDNGYIMVSVKAE